jgi:soluble lytic murein transglycosylase
MSALAELRTYYGFLAAQSIGVPYRFNHADLPATDNQHVAALPAIARAKALLQLNEISEARREWFYGTRSLPQPELMAASALAHQWGWHQQAINTALKAQHTNDLAVRFPLAHRDTILEQAKQQAIPAEWIYAITRQESAFATDAHSTAGAKGLMQLRPGTAKDVASSLGLSFNSQDLYQADTNLTLGSHYLQQLLHRFNGNRILATAAYNAGPRRLENWLQKQQQAMPYDIWIETLPYYETREYIQNVLAFSIIYGHRFDTTLALVEPHEQWIAAPITTTQPATIIH